MFISKKALGPVVATALLLVVAVVAIVGFNTWFVDYSSKTFVDVENRDNSGEALEIKTISGTTLYVKNSVEDNLSITSFEIGDNDCGISEPLSLGMNEIDVSGCLDESNLGESDVVLITEKNVVEKDLYLKDTSIISCTDVDSGLLGLWHFSGDSDDSSGLGNDGVVTGAVLGSDIADNVTSAYTFNLGTDRIETTDVDVPSSFAVSVWVYTNSIGLSARIVDKGTYIIYMGGGGSPVCDFNDAADITAGTNILGTWAHIVCQYTGAQTEIYVDGVLKSIRVGTKKADNNNNLFIGNRQALDRGFDGTIDEVAIYNRSLSSTEVQQIYNYGLNNKPICNP